jgi:large subunit ribosomal protein L31
MKSDIHPEYQYVVFQDVSAGTSFLTRSTISTKETVTWDDGNEYPLAKVEISSESHPFFTGTMKIVDTAGRVERFEKRYGRRKQAAGETPEATAVDTVEADTVEADTVEADTVETVEADTAED